MLLKPVYIISVVFILLFLCKLPAAYGQETKDYGALILEADALFENKAYLASGLKYTEAFMLRGDKGEINDRYNAACAFALAQQADSAFKQLMRIATAGKFSNLDHIKNDKDLDGLHADARWEEVIGIISTNKAKAELHLDKALAASLDSVFEEDQRYRLQLNHTETTKGSDSDEMKKLWNIIQEKDSCNTVFITKLLDERGWLGPDITGAKGNQAIFLVIQHAGLQTQEKYLPMMRDAVAKGNAKPSSLALLEDRVALRKGKRQLYGSQIGFNKETGKQYVLPLEDPLHVDERREKAGLPPMAEYLKNWDLTWDPDLYLKELPGLEALDKK